MKNHVIVPKRSVFRGALVGVAAAVLALTGVTSAWAVGPNGPAPETNLDGSSTATGSYLAGRHAQQTDDWPAAAEFMGRALANDPQNIGLLRRIYLLRLGDGKLAEAVPLARRSRRRNPATIWRSFCWWPTMSSPDVSMRPGAGSPPGPTTVSPAMSNRSSGLGSRLREGR